MTVGHACRHSHVLQILNQGENISFRHDLAWDVDTIIRISHEVKGVYYLQGVVV